MPSNVPIPGRHYGAGRCRRDRESLGGVVKLDTQMCDSFIPVIPAKAGIQDCLTPQNDKDYETPSIWRNRE